MQYKLSDYDYDLPKSLIAQKPAVPREQARLLVYDRSDGSLNDDYFYNLNRYLPDETSLVLNNSKVERCRLQFDDKEIFVLETANPTTVTAMVRPGRSFKLGDVVRIGDQLEVTVLDVREDGLRVLGLSAPVDDMRFDQFKRMPFPPYIDPNDDLSHEYQTVYAKHDGSKAAPTAGLHFSGAMLDNLSKKHNIIEVTLHIGLGTFAPVRTEDVREHKMHSELYHVDAPTASQLTAAKHITAVGTTSARTLESIVVPDIVTRDRLARSFSPGAKETDIFITPGYTFEGVDALITNFHLPKSTLLMMVAALMGYDEMKRVYRHAISHGYRFYSFGDAMLIL